MFCFCFCIWKARGVFKKEQHNAIVCFNLSCVPLLTQPSSYPFDSDCKIWIRPVWEEISATLSDGNSWLLSSASDLGASVSELSSSKPELSFEVSSLSCMHQSRWEKAQLQDSKLCAMLAFKQSSYIFLNPSLVHSQSGSGDSPSPIFIGVILTLWCAMGKAEEETLSGHQLLRKPPISQREFSVLCLFVYLFTFYK